MNGPAGLFRRHALMGAVIALGWFALAWRGFPPPIDDDLFYTGAGIHLAQGAGLVNPWLGFWNVHSVSGRFFIYPPFHSYLLAGWLKLFGISTASLLFFQAACAAIVSGVLASFLYRWRMALWVQPVLAGFLLLFLGTRGLRPDACGLALFALGAQLEAGGGMVKRTWGTSFLIASVGTLPVLTAWLAALFFFRAIVTWRKPDGAAQGKALAARIAIAAAINLILFLWAIDFRLLDFLTDFAACAAAHRNVGGLTYYWMNIGSPSVYLKIVVLPVLALALVLVFLFRKEDAFRPFAPTKVWNLLSSPLWRPFVATAIFTLAATGCVLFSSSSGERLLNLECVVAVLLIFAWERTPGWAGGLALMAVCSLFTVTNGLPLAEWIAARPVRPEQIAAIRDRLAADHADLILIDGYAARELYDYRIPSNVRAATWMQPIYIYIDWRNQPPATRENIDWVISPQTILFMGNLFGSLPEPNPLRIGGHPIPRSTRDENKISVLP